MKTKIKFYLIGIFTSIIITCFFNSCSLIGLGIGSSIDKKTPKTSNVYKSHIDTLKIGSQVEIVLMNGNNKYGKFGGLVQVYDQNFHRKYDSIRNSLNSQISLPGINDTILSYLVSEKDEGYLGLFKGFESGKLWYREFYNNDIIGIELSHIYNFIVNYNYCIDSMQIDSLILEQKFPNFLYLRIDTKQKTGENIPFFNVSKIQLINKRNAKFIGLGLGLAIDVIIVTAAIKSTQNMSFSMSF